MANSPGQHRCSNFGYFCVVFEGLLLFICNNKAYLTSTEEDFGFTQLEFVRVLEDQRKKKLQVKKKHLRVKNEGLP